MKLYRNVSGTLLVIDCLTHTKYLRPGEEALLPISRDVKHYMSNRQLQVVKHREPLPPRRRKRRPKPPASPTKRKKRVKVLDEPEEKLEKQPEKMETE